MKQKSFVRRCAESVCVADAIYLRVVVDFGDAGDENVTWNGTRMLTIALKLRDIIVLGGHTRGLRSRVKYAVAIQLRLYSMNAVGI